MATYNLSFDFEERTGLIPRDWYQAPIPEPQFLAKPGFLEDFLSLQLPKRLTK
jgi:hypothetical protein